MKTFLVTYQYGKPECFQADSVSSNIGGVLFLHRKTGKKKLDYLTKEKSDEQEAYAIIAPGEWRSVVQVT